MTGVVVGKKLFTGRPLKFEVDIVMWSHKPHRVWCPSWNGFDLWVYALDVPRKRLWAFFDDNDIEKNKEVVPSVRVHLEGDTEYRIGRHLGDRRLEPIPA